MEAVAIEVAIVVRSVCAGGDVFGVGIGIEDGGVGTTGVVVVGVGVM